MGTRVERPYEPAPEPEITGGRVYEKEDSSGHKGRPYQGYYNPVSKVHKSSIRRNRKPQERRSPSNAVRAKGEVVEVYKGLKIASPLVIDPLGLPVSP